MIFSLKNCVLVHKLLQTMVERRNWKLEDLGKDSCKQNISYHAASTLNDHLIEEPQLSNPM